MYFLLAALIIAISCSTITIRTLVGYSDFGLRKKIAISSFILLGWFAPLLISLCRKFSLLGTDTYAIFASILYFLFGFVFILFSTLILRDILWYVFYGFCKVLGRGRWSINPKNISVLDGANFVTVLFSVVVSFYSLYQGHKAPDVREITITSPKITQEMNVVLLSDIHVSRLTSKSSIEDLVKQVNSLNPDLILVTGDVIDDKIANIEEQLSPLQKLKSKYGVYASLGNHEFYSGINSSLKKFKDLGMILLFNRGLQVGESNLFVSGIPDMHTAMASEFLNADFDKSLRGSKKENFKILMSHNPDFVDYINASQFDMQVSGHTHGGQIFPFHLLVKKANTYLAGLYKVNGIDLYVSRGVGHWGPAMRLLAPAEITFIKLKS